MCVQMKIFSCMELCDLCKESPGLLHTIREIGPKSTALFLEKRLSQIIMFFGLYVVGINPMFSQCGTDLLLRKLFG